MAHIVRTPEVEYKSVEKQFNCRFCNKKFYNPQALGGHQNAHRYERPVARAVKMDAHENMGNTQYSPYFGATPIDFSRSLSNNQNLWNSKNSMLIHEPLYPISDAALRLYGYGVGHFYDYDYELRLSRPTENINLLSSVNVLHLRESKLNAGAALGNSAFGTSISVPKSVGDCKDYQKSSHSLNQQPESPELDLTLKL